MNLIKLIARDLKLGVIKKWYRFFLIVIIAFTGCFITKNLIDLMLESGIDFQNLTFWDYLFSIVKGSSPYIFSPTEPFEVPLLWFCIQLSFHYIIAYYPAKDFKEFGKTIVCNGKSRVNYWISKCIWCLLATIIYYAIFYISITLFYGMIEGRIDFEFVRQNSAALVSVRLVNNSFKELLIAAVILPMVMTFSLGVLQLLISFVVDPVVSFAGMCIMYVLSSFFTNRWFVGNYSILLRSELINPAGVNARDGFVLAGAIFLLSYIWGCYWIKQTDILD